MQVNGGVSDYTFVALPPGFFIRQGVSSFYLEGIPNKPGTYTFDLKVTDRRNAYTEWTFSMTIEGTESGGDNPIARRLRQKVRSSAWSGEKLTELCPKA